MSTAKRAMTREEFERDQMGETGDTLRDLRRAESMLDTVRAFLSDDGIAITYQTLGQYRSAALKLLRSPQ